MNQLRLLWCLVVLALSCAASAENWPGWRGPRGDGSSLDKNVPMSWSDSENVAWKAAIPGIGHASPVIWGDRVFIVTCLPEKNERQLICLDRKTGQTLWMKVVLTSPLKTKAHAQQFRVKYARDRWQAGLCQLPRRT
ncbi:MAG: hypothetical protein GY809_05145 [Planctomycetes bacterium]|nr:hypothetical protein [Planctomycetota bacterium]